MVKSMQIKLRVIQFSILVISSVTTFGFVTSLQKDPVPYEIEETRINGTTVYKSSDSEGIYPTVTVLKGEKNTIEYFARQILVCSEYVVTRNLVKKSSNEVKAIWTGTVDVSAVGPYHISMDLAIPKDVTPGEYFFYSEVDAKCDVKNFNSIRNPKYSIIVK